MKNRNTLNHGCFIALVSMDMCIGSTLSIPVSGLRALLETTTEMLSR